MRSRVGRGEEQDAIPDDIHHMENVGEMHEADMQDL